MIKYIKWVLRLVIVVVIIFSIILPIYALLNWVGNEKMTIINAFKLAFYKVNGKWWTLDIDE